MDFSIDNSWNDNEIIMNLNFKPNKIFLKFECIADYGEKIERYIAIDDTHKSFSEYFYFDAYRRTRIEIQIMKYTETTMTFRTSETWGDSYNYQLKVTKWIVIG